jgi:hypothetical protein
MRAIAVIAALLIGGCAGQPAVADASEDWVHILTNGAQDMEIQKAADRECAKYHRSARLVSFECGDGYCVQRNVLFACVP